jgi:hypothetical protein
MSTIARNRKVGGTNQFHTEWELGFTDIRADEVDADFNTLFNAWNTSIPNTIPAPTVGDVGNVLTVSTGPSLTWAPTPTVETALNNIFHVNPQPWETTGGYPATAVVSYGGNTYVASSLIPPDVVPGTDPRWEPIDLDLMHVEVKDLRRDILALELGKLQDVTAPVNTPAGKVLGTTGVGTWGPVDPAASGAAPLWEPVASGADTAAIRPISSDTTIESSLDCVETFRWWTKWTGTKVGSRFSARADIAAAAWWVNRKIASGAADDATLAQWSMRIDASSDLFEIQRRVPNGTGEAATLLRLTDNGIELAGAWTPLNTRLFLSNVTLLAQDPGGALLSYNYSNLVTGYRQTAAGYSLGADGSLRYRPANVAAQYLLNSYDVQGYAKDRRMGYDGGYNQGTTIAASASFYPSWTQWNNPTGISRDGTDLTVINGPSFNCWLMIYLSALIGSAANANFWLGLETNAGSWAVLQAGWSIQNATENHITVVWPHVANAKYRARIIMGSVAVPSISVAIRVAMLGLREVPI